MVSHAKFDSEASHPLWGKVHCRGIAPLEGTESDKLSIIQTEDQTDCRGIAPLEGTERYIINGDS
jgi:hypothetical protein